MKQITSEILDRLPPSDLRAEQNLLGSMLLEPRVCDDVGFLEPADFYADANMRLFRTLVSMRSDRQRIDITLLTDRLKASGEFEAIGGAAYLAEVVQSVPYAKNAVFYAEIIQSKSKLRSVILAATEVLRDAFTPGASAEELLAYAEKSLQQIKTGRYDSDPVLLEDATAECLERLQRIMDGKEIAGIKTGLDNLDEEIGGLAPGEMTVLAARPGQGKTTFALQIAYHVAAKGTPVYFASLEMQRMQIAMKNLCRIAKISHQRVRNGQLSAKDRADILSAAIACSVPLHIHDWPKIRPFDIARAARKCKAGLIIVDYLQRVQPTDSAQKRYEQVGAISDGLKTIAGELQVPVLALAQLNRESDKTSGKELPPRLSHLRESGNIEQDADSVWLLWRPEGGIQIAAKGGQPAESYGARLHVAKSRYGTDQKFMFLCDKTAAAFCCPVDPDEQGMDGQGEGF